MSKRALITGVTGQDGSYLSELLLSKGYEVHGLDLRPPQPGRAEKMVFHQGNITDSDALLEVLRTACPDELYHLAGQSSAGLSLEAPLLTFETVALATVKLFGCIREAEEALKKRIRTFHASSAEMFGSTPAPQNESSCFRPVTPYSASKLAAHWYGVVCREAYGMFICNGILFNHESPLRPPTFFGRKVTLGAARIKLGRQDKLRLGNLDVRRDWGFAGDYVDAMWRMLQQESADDYVVATGVSHTLRDFVAEAFAYLGMDWKEHVEIDPALFRAADAAFLEGDATKAHVQLGWEPSVSFEQLIHLMVDHDLKELAS
jgi:GDPmannose 4,6-dehydratase